MEHHCREGSNHSEGHFKVDRFDISQWDSDKLGYLSGCRRQRNWSFAFTHASTSSKCVLFSIRCLIQLCPISTYPWDTEWIVSETIDWLKVRNPALIKEIFCNPDRDIWEEPNSGSSTAGSADRLGGRCTQENRRGDSNSEAKGY
jgi:hypothetical protein